MCLFVYLYNIAYIIFSSLLTYLDMKGCMIWWFSNFFPQNLMTLVHNFLWTKVLCMTKSPWIFFGNQICEVGGLWVGDHAQEDLTKLWTNFPQRLQAFLQFITHWHLNRNSWQCVNLVQNSPGPHIYNSSLQIKMSVAMRRCLNMHSMTTFFLMWKISYIRLWWWCDWLTAGWERKSMSRIYMSKKVR